MVILFCRFVLHYIGCCRPQCVKQQWLQKIRFFFRLHFWLMLHTCHASETYHTVIVIFVYIRIHTHTARTHTHTHTQRSEINTCEIKYILVTRDLPHAKIYICHESTYPKSLRIIFLQSIQSEKVWLDNIYAICHVAIDRNTLLLLPDVTTAGLHLHACIIVVVVICIATKG